MALTRKFLSALGIEGDKIEQIIEAHTETVDGLKQKLAEAEAAASSLEAVTKERDTLKAAGDFKGKYEAEHKAFEAYKAEVTGREARAAKEAAVRAYLESKHITGGNLDIAVRGMSAEIDAVELDGDKIKDTKPLDELIGGTFKGLVVSTQQTGTQTATPPTGGAGTMTKEQIMSIKDTAARQKAIYENHTLFGI